MFLKRHITLFAGLTLSNSTICSSKGTLSSGQQTLKLRAFGLRHRRQSNVTARRRLIFGGLIAGAIEEHTQPLAEYMTTSRNTANTAFTNSETNAKGLIDLQKKVVAKELEAFNDRGEIRKSLDAYKIESDGKHTAASERLNKHDGRIKDLETDTTELKSDVKTLQDNVGTNTDDIATNKKEITKAMGKADKNIEKLTKAKGKYDTLELRLKDNDTDVTNNTDNIDTLTKTSTKHGTAIEKLNGNVSTLQDDYRTLDGKVSSLETDMAVAENKVGNLETGLENALKSISDNDTNASKARDVLEKLMRDENKELRAEFMSGDAKTQAQIIELMEAKNSTLRAQYVCGDLETKLEVMEMMNAENASLRAEFLSGDEKVQQTCMDLMKTENARLRAEYLKGDAETKLSVMEMMDDNNAIIREEFLAGDDRVQQYCMDLMDAKNAALKESYLSGDKDVKLWMMEMMGDVKEDHFDHQILLKDELADLKSELAGMEGKLCGMGENDMGDISQNVNIDLDLGSMGHGDGFSFDTFFSMMEWWHYLIVGVGMLLAVAAKCFFKDEERSALGGPNALY